MKSNVQETMLYIVPTPIGNLGDMTYRALEVLKQVDYIASEDTRVMAKLLRAFGIEGKKVIRLDENVMKSKAQNLISRMRQGETFAFCSDAGMPGVSDPGGYLVRLARQAGIKTEILPGASAAITAYVASGASVSSFYFGGFVPRKNQGRTKLFSSLMMLPSCLIFYESPHRLCTTLKILTEIMPARRITVCRELTKMHEEVLSGKPGEMLQDFSSREQIKGEIVLVIDPATEEDENINRECIEKRINELSSQGLSNKTVVAKLIDEFSLARNEAYTLVLKNRS